MSLLQAVLFDSEPPQVLANAMHDQNCVCLQIKVLADNAAAHCLQILLWAELEEDISAGQADHKAAQDCGWARHTGHYCHDCFVSRCLQVG